MLKEKVARIKCYADEPTCYYIFRSWDRGCDFWLYTIEDDKQILKTFCVEPVEPNVYISRKTSIEEYLKEFKNQNDCIILYEVEYLHKNELDKRIGFKTLREWYEEFLRYVDNEVFESLKDDFVKGFWRIYERFYRDNEDFRKLLSIERYILSNMFSSILSYVEDIITNEITNEELEDELEDEDEFVNRLYEVANKLSVRLRL